MDKSPGQTNSYAGRIVRQLNDDRQSDRLCDVIIRIDGRDFPAHRGVLAAGSTFFSGLFISDMREKSQDVVELQSVSADCMDDVLSYIYTGEIKLTPDNAQLVIVIADFMLLPDLKKMAEQYLSKAFDLSDPINCAVIYDFAVLYDCCNLAESVFPGIVKNIELVLQSGEVLELTGKSLLKFISSYNRPIDIEEAVFNAIVKWTKHKDDRCKIFDELFFEIHLESLSKEFLSSVLMNENLVILSEACLKLLAIQIFDLIGDSKQFLEINLDALEETLACDELHVSSEEVVFKAILKWVNHHQDRKGYFSKLFSKVRLQSISEEFLQSSIETNDLVCSNPGCCSLLEEHKSKTYDPFEINCQHPRECLDNYTSGIVILPTKHYRPDTLYTPWGTPWLHVPAENKWYHFPHDDDIAIVRDQYGVPLYHHGTLYVVQPITAWATCILKYEKESQEWVTISEGLSDEGTTGAISKHGAVCLQGIIYIVGGMEVWLYRATSGVAVNRVHACDITVEVQDEFLDITLVEPMNECRIKPCVLADDKYLYVAGGYTLGSKGNNVFTNTMERYDPTEKTWIFLSPMKERSSLTGDYLCSLSSGKIFICQVNSDINDDRNPIELYDIATDSWSEIISLSNNCNIMKGLLVSSPNRLFHVTAKHQVIPTKGHKIVLESTCYNFKRVSWKLFSFVEVKIQDRPWQSIGPFSLQGAVIRLAKRDLEGFKAI